MTCLDFELKVGVPSGRTVPLSVLGSPAGEGRVDMTFPYDSLALENRLQSLQLALLASGPTRRRLTPEYEQAVQSFGSEMFDALFTGDVRSLFDRSRQEAVRRGADLRIQLRFDSADMAALPWEFLYDARRGEYLCLSTTTPVVRYVELAEPQEPLAVAPPLRLLAMAASPSDLPALDVQQERARMETALGRLDGRFELHWVEGQTWRDLQGALRAGPWHAFHFVGHGGFDANLGEGVIALTADGGGTHRLCATDLGRLLGDHHPLRLAVLNACDGARADRMDVFSSTAAVLVRRGTPAVVAMQYEITDRAAVELSRAFYGALAAGLPVDEALGEARKSVALAVPGTLEWGTPVLYLRAPEGRIFDLDTTDTVPLRGSRAPAPVAGPAAPLTTGLPVVAKAEPAGGAAEPTARPQATARPPGPASKQRKLLLAGAAAAGALLVVVVISLLSRPDKATGGGTFELAVEREGGYVTHAVSVPKDTILLVEVNPSDDLDPDVGAGTDVATGRDLALYLKDANYDRARFRGLLADYGYDPAGKVLVARTDERASGERERLLVTAPHGGHFDIVVAGADDSAGSFELEVTAVRFPADGDGTVYVDDLVDDARVRRFISQDSRTDLAETGSIQRGFDPNAGDEGDADGGAGDEGDVTEPLSVHVSVPAAGGWTDAGVDVADGYELTFSASGEVFDDLEGNPGQSYDPDGVADPDGRHAGDPFRQFDHAALLGKIGEDGDPFLIGSDRELTAEQEGRLFLGVNDGRLDDNGGSFEVDIDVA
ncbi:MAG TPA: CHAT domain-containing protein [Acidimicrobiales bacterium]|nr:CHAT domain-containing protein [Acidimicrobiales bacterium]